VKAAPWTINAVSIVKPDFADELTAQGSRSSARWSAHVAINMDNGRTGIHRVANDSDKIT